MAKNKRGDSGAATTAQALGSLLKSARDIMRKDKGLNGDLDRLPLLTWIMFLKFLDDLEIQHEQEARLAGKRFRSAIESPYRWRDWAGRNDGMTGDELLAFVNQEDVVRPDGRRGKGLFAYLRGLTSSNGDSRRDVVATVFRGVDNRMRSGYLLRDVLNKVNGICFTSTAELHTLGALYESMLREMRDAAGDSGEFYTPRPVVRFMVEVVNPRLGEIVLDPACGTGGFLVEAFSHLAKQVQTVEDQRALQEASVIGVEPKSLPYLLAQMNLLLHGLDAPQIDPGNALRFKLTEIGEKDRVDIILTNPPFGGAEEKGIQGNFPEDMQSSETALLFLQLIMRKLRRVPRRGESARAAVVVPDGILSGEGVAARVRRELVENFNLHTVVRLPKGVFVPYTPIETNILFFDVGPRTSKVWFYELPITDGRQIYTKTRPIQYEEFADCLKWWSGREETDRAWRVSIDDIAGPLWSLDVKNPRRQSEVQRRDPAVVAVRLRGSINKFGSILTDILALEERLKVRAQEVIGSSPVVPLAEVLEQSEERVNIVAGCQYALAGVRLNGKGPFMREVKDGGEIKTNKLTPLHQGQFIYSRLFAWRGAFGVVSPELDGAHVSNEFPVFNVDRSRLLPEYLRWYFAQPSVWEEVEKQCTGTTKASRNRFKESKFIKWTIPLPEEPRDQQELVSLFDRASDLTEIVQKELQHSITESDTMLASMLMSAFARGTDSGRTLQVMPA